MLLNWKTAFVITSTLVISAIGVLVWKKKRNFVKVGKISKLLFFPVKSLKAIEVSKGRCSKLGFVINGLLDRSFMVVDANGNTISQYEQSSIILLTPRIERKTLIISTPTGEELKVSIKDSINPGDRILDCVVLTDSTKAVDCGEEAATFLESFFNISGVRLVQQVPSLTGRNYLRKNAFEKKVRKDHPIGLQNFTPFHILSQASVDDLNLRLENHSISELNFRPNILIHGCQAYDEDSWRYIKFNDGVILSNILLTTRCLITRNNPSTGILNLKEPLMTMRRFRIPQDRNLLKKIGYQPRFGISCGVEQTGEISVGNEIFADIGERPQMKQK